MAEMRERARRRGEREMEGEEETGGKRWKMRERARRRGGKGKGGQGRGSERVGDGEDKWRKMERECKGRDRREIRKGAGEGN